MNIQRITAILNSPVLTLRSRSARRLDWKEVVANSGLSGETRDLISHVVKRTRLWSSEKHDVAEELVSHFVEGRELGKSEAELIERFGSPAGTARLIRRSKKKNRPLLWHMMAWTRTGLVSIVLVYGLMVAVAVTRKPSPVIDFNALIDRSRPDVPQAETAWGNYMEIFRTYDVRDFKYASPESGKWDSTVSQFNERFESAVPEIRKAANHAYSGIHGRYAYEYTKDEWMTLMGMSEQDFMATYPDGRGPAKDPERKYNISEILLPHASLYKSLSLITATHGLIAAARHDYEDIPGDIDTIFRIARHCSEESHFISELVAIAGMWHAHDLARRLYVDTQRLPEISVTRRILDTYHQFTPPDWTDLESEEYMLLDIIQHSYSDNGHGDGTLTLEGLKMLEKFGFDTQSLGIGVAMGAMLQSDLAYAILPVIQARAPGKRELTSYIESAFDYIEECSRLPLWKLNEVRIEWEKMKTDHSTAGIPEVSMTKDVELFLPMLDHIEPYMVMKPTLNRVHHENTKLILAIHGYYAEQGQWPEQLNDLVPGWLSEVPLDASSGKPLIYRIEDGRPLIYGRGYDGVDDGGHFDLPDKPGFHWSQGPTDKGDWLIWPVPVIGSTAEAAAEG